MISNNDNAGLVSFILGIIVLVMVATGLSLLLEKRFRFSSSKNISQREIESLTAELEHLKLIHRTATNELAKIEPIATRAAEELSSLRSTKVANSEKLTELSTASVELKAAIKTLERDFANYRHAYRQKQRVAAVGRKLGNFALKDGREYKNAVIIKVTDVGLEIRHQTGTARILSPDLDAAMQNLYQWDRVERTKQLIQE